MKLHVRVRNTKRVFDLGEGKVDLGTPKDLVIGEVTLANVEKKLSKLKHDRLKEYKILRNQMMSLTCLEDLRKVNENDELVADIVVSNAIRDIGFVDESIKHVTNLLDFMKLNNKDSYKIKNECEDDSELDMHKLYLMYDVITTEDEFTDVKLSTYKLAVMENVLHHTLLCVVGEEEALEFLSDYTDSCGNISKLKGILFADNGKYHDLMVKYLDYLTQNWLFGSDRDGFMTPKTDLFDALIEKVHQIAISILNATALSVAEFLVGEVVYRDTSKNFLVSKGVGYNGTEKFDADVILTDINDKVVFRLDIPVTVK